MVDLSIGTPVDDTPAVLTRALAAGGNRGEAGLAYRRCRRWLRERAGADPSPETERLRADLLGP